MSDIRQLAHNVGEEACGGEFRYWTKVHGTLCANRTPLPPPLPFTRLITVFPLSGRRVDDAKELVIGHSLWVEVRPHRSALGVLVGAVQ